MLPESPVLVLLVLSRSRNEDRLAWSLLWGPFCGGGGAGVGGSFPIDAGGCQNQRSSGD